MAWNPYPYVFLAILVVLIYRHVTDEGVPRRSKLIVGCAIGLSLLIPWSIVATTLQGAAGIYVALYNKLTSPSRWWDQFPKRRVR